MMRKTVFIYGARGPTFLSGWPYYFARALERYGKERNAFRVVDVAPRRTRELPITFLSWCLSSRTRRSSLFLLSQNYHNASGRGLTVTVSPRPYFVAFTQCVPESILICRRKFHQARLIHYLDATLLDLFESFDYARNPPTALREEMLRNELNGYRMTDLFAVFHEGVRDRLIADYDVDRAKILVLGRGANLELDSAFSTRSTRRNPQGGKLRMMVVGKGPSRKGVFKLIDAIDALQPPEQNKLVLTVAGPEPHELPERSYLRRLGFIGARQRDRLIAEMQSSDLGVLLSEAEGYPGSVWEFLSLGVPVWATRLPYLDSALEGCPAILENLPLTKAALVQRLQSFIQKPETHSSLLKDVHNLAERLSWAPQADRLGQYIVND